MQTRTFHPRQFLRLVYGTEPFVQYCRSRGIAFEQLLGWLMHDEDYQRWDDALRALPPPEQARIELELLQANEMAHPDAVANLVAAAAGRELPDDAIPGDAARSLWFFLHHPNLFQEVFLHQEIASVDSWRIARGQPGKLPNDLARRRQALATSLREFFHVTEGTGRFCAVDAYRFGETTYFVAYLSDHLRFSEVFTEEGQHATRVSRPAFPVVFVYEPGDGRIFLKARQRAAETVLDLFRRFGLSVLGIELTEDSLDPLFRLDLLKRRFDPPLSDREMTVRVKALHLAYPERYGRRVVKLQTLAGDGQFAILDLLREHGGSGGLLDQLEVLYAELSVQLPWEGCRKHCLIRLWPDRCSLDHSALGQQLFAYLRRWGICHGPTP